MSGFENARSISLACGAADVRQYRFVKASAAGVVECGAGDDSVGIALEGYVHANYTAGGASNVIPVAQLDGAKLMVEAGAAIAAGAPIAADADGQAVTAAGVTTNVLGYALEAAGAAGVMIQIVGTKKGFMAQT